MLKLPRLLLLWLVSVSARVTFKWLYIPNCKNINRLLNGKSNAFSSYPIVKTFNFCCVTPAMKLLIAKSFQTTVYKLATYIFMLLWLLLSLGTLVPFSRN